MKQKTLIRKFVHLKINFLQVMAISEQMCESFVADVVAALGYEVPEFSTTISQSLYAVAGNKIAPWDVLKCET